MGHLALVDFNQARGGVAPQWFSNKAVGEVLSLSSVCLLSCVTVTPRDWALRKHTSLAVSPCLHLFPKERFRGFLDMRKES